MDEPVTLSGAPPTMEGLVMGTALGFLLLRTYDGRPRVWMEKLETRRLFSVASDASLAVMLNDANQPVATAQVIDGILTVVTGDGADDVMLGTARGDADQLFIYVNGVRRYFSRGEITGVSIDLGDGDDGFGVQNWDGLLNLPTTVNGGAGDDSIGGGNRIVFPDTTYPKPFARTGASAPLHRAVRAHYPLLARLAALVELVLTC